MVWNGLVSFWGTNCIVCLLHILALALLIRSDMVELTTKLVD